MTSLGYTKAQTRKDLSSPTLDGKDMTRAIKEMDKSLPI